MWRIRVACWISKTTRTHERPRFRTPTHTRRHAHTQTNVWYLLLFHGNSISRTHPNVTLLNVEPGGSWSNLICVFYFFQVRATLVLNSSQGGKLYTHLIAFNVSSFHITAHEFVSDWRVDFYILFWFAQNSTAKTQGKYTEWKLAQRKVLSDDIFAVVECYAALTGTWLPTFRDNLLVEFSKVKTVKFFLNCLCLEDGTSALSWNVGNHQSTLRNIPEERRPHLHCGGSLKYA